MSDPLFFTKDAVLAFHAEQIELYGGSSGLRDDGLLESALSSPENHYCYEEKADIFDLAAQYLSKIAGNHPFIDGNKRTATVTCLSFLKINGLTFTMEPLLLAALVEEFVVGKIFEDVFARVLFLGCLKDIQEEAFDYEIPPPPESYLNAKVPGERTAIVADFVTSRLRARLIDICPKYCIRPDRFDGLLNQSENMLFRMVEAQWRSQFGMTCDDGSSSEEIE